MSALNVAAPMGGIVAPSLYKLHGFEVLDLEGNTVGIVDWMWANDAGSHGEFIGVGLRWLRGTVRAVPAFEAEVDQESRTIRVGYTASQIKRAERYKIDRRLRSDQKLAICSYYTDRPEMARRPIVVRRLAA